MKFFKTVVTAIASKESFNTLSCQKIYLNIPKEFLLCKMKEAWCFLHVIFERLNNIIVSKSLAQYPGCN